MPGKRIGKSVIYSDGRKTYSLIGKPRQVDGAQRLRCTDYKHGCKGSAHLYIDGRMSNNRPHTCDIVSSDIDARKMEVELKDAAGQSGESVRELHDDIKQRFDEEASRKVPLWRVESNLHRIRKRVVPKDWQCYVCEEWLDRDGEPPSMLIPCTHSLCATCAREIDNGQCPKYNASIDNLISMIDFPAGPQ